MLYCSSHILTVYLSGFRSCGPKCRRLLDGERIVIILSFYFQKNAALQGINKQKERTTRKENLDREAENKTKTRELRIA